MAKVINQNLNWIGGDTHVVQLGDILDRRKYVNFKTLTDFNNKIVSQFKKYDTHFIVGNHDTYYKNTNEVNAPKELLSDLKKSEIFYRLTHDDKKRFVCSFRLDPCC